MGLKPVKSNFLHILESRKKSKKKNFQEKSVFIGKNRFLLEKSVIFRRFFFSRFFHPNIFSSTTEIRFFSEKSVEISDFFVHIITIFVLLAFNIVCEALLFFFLSLTLSDVIPTTISHFFYS